MVKRRIVTLLREKQHEVVDVGTDTGESVDYPDYAVVVANQVSRGEADRGILICGTGLGMAIAANKVPGVRATPVHDDLTAELSRSHNNSNVLCLSADILGQPLIDHIVEIWLKTEFEGGRHSRRIDKISAIEQNHRT